MARRTISLDEKIEKAEAVMLAAKAKYDAALDEIEKLVAKRKQQDDKKRFLMLTMQAIRRLMKSLLLYSLKRQRPIEG